jgi:hypothetical protein
LPLLGQQLFAQTDLNGSAAIAQRHKNQLADISKKYDPAGTIRLLFRLVVFKSVLDIFCRGGAIVSVSVRIDAQFFNPGQFFLPLPFELAYIFCL